MLSVVLVTTALKQSHKKKLQVALVATDTLPST